MLHVFQNMPVHPFMVHLPLGLATVLPLIALGQSIAILKNWIPRKVWIAVVLLQTLLLGSSFLAKATGEETEMRVQRVVDHEEIEEHEEAAMRFIWSAGLSLAAAIAALVWGGSKRGIALRFLTVGLMTITLGLGALTGHKGGKLVYQFGAAEGYYNLEEREMERFMSDDDKDSEK